MALEVIVTLVNGKKEILDLWDVHCNAGLQLHAFEDDCIPTSAFRDHSDIRKIAIPKGITVINSLAFQNCSALEEVIFPDTLIEIEDHAFQGCRKLNEIVLPNTVRHIDEYAFAGSGLKKVSVKNPEKDETFFKAISKYTSSSSEFPNNIRLDSTYYFYIGKSAFQGCKELTDITIPDGINRICERAFEDCEKLEKIISSVVFKRIEFATFKNCHSLKNIPFVENLIEIGIWAFGYCSSLEIATFPQSLEKIDYAAFCGSGLKKVSFSKENDTTIIIGEKAFNNCEALEEFTFPKGSTVKFSILDNCPNLRHIFIEK